MRKVIALFVFLLIPACATTPQPVSHVGLEGTWEGSGVQDNNTTWTIKVTIAQSNSSIDYPSLNCGGTLKLIDRQRERMEFRESLTYGLSNCVNGGKTVIVKVGANQAKYEWYYANGKRGATGTLTR